MHKELVRGEMLASQFHQDSHVRQTAVALRETGEQNTCEAQGRFITDGGDAKGGASGLWVGARILASEVLGGRGGIQFIVRRNEGCRGQGQQLAPRVQRQDGGELDSIVRAQAMRFDERNRCRNQRGN